MAALLLGLVSAAAATPAHAQAVVIGTRCDGTDGVITVQINTGTDDIYNIYLNGTQTTEDVTSGGPPIPIGPVIDGTHNVRVDEVGGGTLSSSSVVVNCDVVTTTAPATSVKPTGGVETGGGGTASGGGLGSSWIVLAAGLVAGVAGAVLVRDRLAA
ncbi:MAG: hypothetical protein ACR2QO_06810 [Acidimicrobiales bacterium]